MRIDRLRFFSACIALVGLLGALGTSATAQAQDYPNKPIRLVLAQGPGGSSDVVARLLSQRLAEALGQPVLVDHRPGANGLIAVDTVVKAPPDGYTLFLGATPYLAINPALYKKLPYDPVTDFSHVALLGSTYYAVLVPTTSPANSVKEFIALAKSKPGALNYGAGGTGAHANIGIFMAGADIDIKHIPYKSNTQALMDLIGGRVDLIFESTPTAIPQVRSGKVKAIGITSPERIARYAELPTVAESGVPGYEFYAFISIHAPAGVPAPILNKLSAEILKIMARPDVAEQFRTLGIEPKSGGPEELVKLVQRDIAYYKKAFVQAGIPSE